MKRLKLFAGLVAALFVTAPVATDAQRQFVASDAPTGDTWAANTHWYQMKMKNGGVISLSNTTKLGRLKANGSATAEISDMTALWAFVGSEEAGYKIYNMAAGPNVVMGLTGSEAEARVEMYASDCSDENVKTTFIRHDSSVDNNTREGFAIEGNNALNNRGGFLALWNSSWAWSDEGSALIITEVSDLSGIDYATSFTTYRDKMATLTQYFGFTTSDAEYSTKLAAIKNATLSDVTAAGYNAAVSAINTNHQAVARSLRALNNTKWLINCTGRSSYPYMFINDAYEPYGKRDKGPESVWTLQSAGHNSFYLYNEYMDRYLGFVDNDEVILPTTQTPSVSFNILTQSDGTNALFDESRELTGWAHYCVHVEGWYGKVVRWAEDADPSHFTFEAPTSDLDVVYKDVTFNYNVSDGKTGFSEARNVKVGRTVASQASLFGYTLSAEGRIESGTDVYAVNCSDDMASANPVMLKVANNKFVYVLDSDDATTKTNGSFLNATLSGKGQFLISRVAGSNLHTIQRADNNKYLTAASANNQTLGTWETAASPWTEGTGATSYFRLPQNGDGFSIQHPGNAQANMGNHVDQKLGFWTGAGSPTHEASRIYIKDIKTEALAYIPTITKNGEGKVNYATSDDQATTINGIETVTMENLKTIVGAVCNFNAAVGSNKYYQIVFDRKSVVMGNEAAYANADGNVSEQDDARTVYTLTSEELNGGNLLSTLWQFETAADGTTYIKNANTGFYVGNVYGGTLCTTKQQTNGRPYLFIPANDGVWVVRDPQVTNNMYNLNSYYNPDAQTPNLNRSIGYWTGDFSDGGNTFAVKEVTSIPVTITSVGYATLNLPMAVEIASDVKAYYGAKDNTSTITLAEISGNVIPANTPVILVAQNTLSEATQFNFNISYTEAGTAPESNALTGTTCKQKMNAGAGVYVLKKGNSGIGFYRVDSTTDLTIGANKAYYGNANGSTEVVRFDFGGTTAIEGAPTLKADDATLYDLNGRRVIYPTTGVYVKANGEKVFVK